MSRITPTHLLAAFIGLMLVLGLFISKDYGYTTDEDSERTRAKIALSHYGIPNDSRQNSYAQLHHKMYYGTAVSMLGVLADELLSPILGTPVNTVWHAVNYLLFLAGVVGMYYLVRLFASDGIALFGSLLYASQPLYFGHAFMNPKDMPLQAMFILTVTLGFYIERQTGFKKHIEKPYTIQSHLAYWRALWASWRPLLRWMNAAALVLLLFLLLFQQPIVGFATRVFAYGAAHPAGLPGRLVWALASPFDISPGALAVQQMVAVYERYYPLQALLLALYLAVVVFITHRRRPSLRGASPVLRYSGSLVLLAAGAIFGLALSTRLIAFAAGGLVGLYYLWSYRHRAIPPLVLYSAVALLVHYLTWPVYWEFSFFNILRASLSLLMYFDPLSGVGVLFEGQIYRADALPHHYLAKLVGLQLTPPLLLLAGLGIFLWLWSSLRRRAEPATFRKELLVLLWFLLPLAYISLDPPVMYNTFRQFLFITPPLVVFACLGLQHLQPHLPRALLAGGMALCLLPGVVAIFSLHPYQYVYFNAFAGGTRGAFETYELDYWYLAIPEAMDYLNATAQPNAQVYVTYGADDHARLYQRPDLHIPKEDIFANVSAANGYHYAIISTNSWQPRQVPVTWTVLHTVQAGGAPLFIIYTVN